MDILVKLGYNGVIQLFGTLLTGEYIMKTKNIFTVTLVALAANFSLTACETMDKKASIDERNTPARAYTADPSLDRASNDNRWMLVNTGPKRNLDNANPAALSDIETAAGPGAAPANSPVILKAGDWGTDRYYERF